MSLACTPRNFALGLLAIWVGISAGRVGLTAPGRDTATDGLALHAKKAESLLRSGRIRQALAEAALAERSAPNGAEPLALLGDISFRQADFEAAEKYFNAALASDPRCVRAHLGLARLDQLHFRRGAALQRVVTAYSLSPNDPETVLAYSSVTSDPKQEILFLQKYLTFGAGVPREQFESAEGRLQFRQRLGSRKLTVLDGPYIPYRLPLTVWATRRASPNGLLLAVSINGSKPLRLVFDTGAAGIVISHRSAVRLGLEYLADAGLQGVGDSGIETKKTLADSVRIGNLRLRNCVVDVAAHDVAGEVDGAIGANVFEQFIVRLDGRHRVLDLLPYPDEVPRAQSQEDLWAGRDRSLPAGMENLTPVCQTGHLLLVQTKLDSGTSGYMILDTGAAYSSLSRQATLPFAEPTPFEIAGPGGGLVTAFQAGPTQLHVAGHDLADPEVVALDFARISNLHGLEISGLIGYPMLSRYALTLEYRDGLIGLDRSR